MLFQLDDSLEFPPVEMAQNEPDGLLAIGGTISPDSLLKAYPKGIFPWYEEEPVLWWSPSQRAVLRPKEFHASKSLKKWIRQEAPQIRVDSDFSGVIDHCQQLRSEGTWITPALKKTFIRLHEMGYAHSVEVYLNKTLIGGLYGLNIGRCFCAESMFHIESNASKAALLGLSNMMIALDYPLIDCQVVSEHLSTLAVKGIPRSDFIEELQHLNTTNSKSNNWRLTAENINLLSLEQLSS